MQNNQVLEELFARGVAHFRAAEWEEAIDALTQLRALTSAYPEVETLIADAQFKLEIERREAPEEKKRPKHRKILRPRFLTAVPVLLVFAGFLIWLRPMTVLPPEPTPLPTRMVSLPSPAPTNTTLPTNTPEPTNTPAPTKTPLPGSGDLTVRMVAGQPVSRNQNIEIILDASGSMNATIGDQRRIDIAHQALNTLLTELPATTNVALRAYGHRRGGDCSDIELIAPLGPLDSAALTARVNTIFPANLGQTPIGTSLQQGAEDLKNVSGDVRLVLVSDGEENCNVDPVQTAGQLRAQNPRLAIDVIGFTVDSATSDRLNAVAQAGGGSYFDAGNAQQLSAALREAILRSYRVLDANGTEVYRGIVGTSINLPVGTYSIELLGAEALQLQDITVDGLKPAVIELNDQDGVLNAATPSAQ